MDTLHFERIKSEAGGNRASQVIVLIHGLFGSLSNVQSLGRLLARQYIVYSLDLPNHGRSPWTDSARYEEAGRSLHNTLARIASETVGEDSLHQQTTESKAVVHVYGHSMGGKVAMALALLQTDLHANAPQVYTLGKLIVGDIAPRAYPPGHNKYFRAMQEMPKVRQRKEADEYMRGLVSDPVLRSFLLKNLRRSDDGCLAWTLNVDLLQSDYEEILAWNIPPDYRSQLPTLFIRGGESEYIIPSRDRAAIWGHFPHARIEEIEGAGHWIHSEKTEAVYSLIHEFISL